MKSEISVASGFLILNLVVLSISSAAIAAKGDDSRICEKHMNAAAVAEEVPIGLLYAVALTETGSGGELNPFALNIEGTPFLASSTTEAVAMFQEARKADKKLIDLGCMQINYHYHHRNFSSVPAMLDPQQNVYYAAKLLRSLRARHGSWTEAVARYHAGPKNKPAQHRYVCKVLTHMVASDFGSWTPEAKSYCSPKTE
jgi:soluble lytic murein transglycosylase-like protein